MTTTFLQLPFASGEGVRNVEAYVRNGQTLATERVFGVAKAQVIFANYAAIQADFDWRWPNTHDLAELWTEIDAWLLQHAAFISSSQARSLQVNTPIALDGRSAPALRPPRYGRAALLCDSASSQILFDVKGIGVPPDEIPVLPNSNGLLTLGEAIHEVLMEQLVLAIMRHAGAEITPLPSYALLDLRFDALWQDGRIPEPAVLLLRRPTTRPHCQWQGYPQGRELAQALLQVELLLRRYGVTASSCGAVRFKVRQEQNGTVIERDGVRMTVCPEVSRELARRLSLCKQKEAFFDGVNVQLAGEYRDRRPSHLQVMDFGRYRFQGHFEHHLYSWIEVDYESLHGVYLSPVEDDYVQPHPELSLAHMLGTAAYTRLAEEVRLFRWRRRPEALCAAFQATLEEARHHLVDDSQR